MNDQSQHLPPAGDDTQSYVDSYQPPAAAAQAAPPSAGDDAQHQQSQTDQDALREQARQHLEELQRLREERAAQFFAANQSNAPLNTPQESNQAPAPVSAATPNQDLNQSDFPFGTRNDASDNAKPPFQHRRSQPLAPVDTAPTAAPTPSPTPVVEEPTPAPVSEFVQATATTAAADETLEAQNIFYMLGIEHEAEDQKEAFLDELQDVIWEDFLEKDVQLLVTGEEYEAFKQLNPTDPQKQNEVLEYLESVIPDLQQILTEKALELKADLFHERLLGLREFFSGQTEKLEELVSAEALMRENKWHSAAAKLNQIPL